MSFNAFLGEMRPGFREPVYLLRSRDPFLAGEAERLIRESVDEVGRDFAFHSFDLDPPADPSAVVKEIVGTLNTYSLLSEKKSVVVRNCQRLKQKDLGLLGRYVESPSDSSTLFLFFTEASKGGKKTPLQGCRVLSLDMGEQELKKWLLSRAKDLGTTLSPQVMDYLFEMVGHEPGKLASEIDKLSLLGKQSPEVRDAADIVSGQSGANTFDFTGALVSGDKKKAFELAVALREADPGMLLGAVNWEISRRGRTGRGPGLLRSYRVLIDADTVNKSAGGPYPIELLAIRLLARK